MVKNFSRGSAYFFIFEGLLTGVPRRPSSIVSRPSVRPRPSSVVGMPDARPELIEAKGCGCKKLKMPKNINERMEKVGNAQENKRGKLFKHPLI